MSRRSSMVFEPRLVNILCQWCSYSAADLAGASRLIVLPNVRVMRVMCTGRIDPTLVLTAFANGADGVLVCGCHPGDCHYVNGNLKAYGRLTMLHRVLADLGVEPERFRLEWVSAQEAERYSAVTTAMVERLRQLPPLAWPARVKQSEADGT